MKTRRIGEVIAATTAATALFTACTSSTPHQSSESKSRRATAQSTPESQPATPQDGWNSLPSTAAGMCMERTVELNAGDVIPQLDPPGSSVGDVSGNIIVSGTPGTERVTIAAGVITSITTQTNGKPNITLRMENPETGPLTSLIGRTYKSPEELSAHSIFSLDFRADPLGMGADFEEIYCRDH